MKCIFCGNQLIACKYLSFYECTNHKINFTVSDPGKTSFFFYNDFTIFILNDKTIDVRKRNSLKPCFVLNNITITPDNVEEKLKSLMPFL
jgi:hypothetical protein